MSSDQPRRRRVSIRRPADFRRPQARPVASNEEVEGKVASPPPPADAFHRRPLMESLLYGGKLTAVAAGAPSSAQSTGAGEEAKRELRNFTLEAYV